MAIEAEPKVATEADIEEMVVLIFDGRGGGSPDEVRDSINRVMMKKGFNPDDSDLRRRIGVAYTRYINS